MLSTDYFSYGLNQLADVSLNITFNSVRISDCAVPLKLYHTDSLCVWIVTEMYCLPLFCSVYSFYENTDQSIIQSSLLCHGRFIVLSEPLGQTIHHSVWWDSLGVLLSTFFDDLVLPLQETAFMEENVIGLGPNNVMAVTVIGSSFRSKLELWLRRPSLPLFVCSVWVYYMKVLFVFASV